MDLQSLIILSLNKASQCLMLLPGTPLLGWWQLLCPLEWGRSRFLSTCRWLGPAVSGRSGGRLVSHAAPAASSPASTQTIFQDNSPVSSSCVHPSHASSPERGWKLLMRYWFYISFKKLFHEAVSTESCSVLIKKSSCNNIISKLPRHWRGPGRVAQPGSPSPRGPLWNSKHQIGRWIYHPGNKCIQLPYLCCTERANKTNRSRHRGNIMLAKTTLKHQWLWLLHYCALK